MSVLPPDLLEFLGLSRPPVAQQPAAACPAGSYARTERVDGEKLIRFGLDRVGSQGRNNAGFWLAGQLRDNGYSKAESEPLMASFRNRCPAFNAKGIREPYTEAEVQSTLRAAYGRAARPGWERRSHAGASAQAAAPPDTMSPKGAGGVDGGGGESKKPSTAPGALAGIVTNNRQLRDPADEALAALLRKNEDCPTLFSRGGGIVKIVRDERSRTIVRQVTTSELRGDITRAANFYKVNSAGAKLAVYVPLDIVCDVASRPPEELGLPPLHGVVETPIIRPDGSVSTREGYDPATRLYYAPGPGFSVPPISDKPSTGEIGLARELLLRLFGEFPFVDESSRANVIGLLMTALLKPAFGWPSQMGAIDATQAATGKSLVADLIAIVITGRAGEMLSMPRDDDELRKQITSVLVASMLVAVFDNVVGRVTSPELAKLMTESWHSDRAFRTHELMVLPVNTLFLMTGNNLQVGGDMPRRCLWIRMDARTSRPFMRTGFQIPDLKGWALEHRGELVAALLTLARAWFEARCPNPSLAPLGGYEGWSTTIGGILEYCGVPGFLGNFSEFYAVADAESTQWEAFLQALDKCFVGEAFTLHDVMVKLREKRLDGFSKPEPTEEAVELRTALPDYLAEVADREGFFQRRAGKCFAERVGRRFGESEIHLRRDGFSHKVQLWKIGGLGG